MEPRTEQFHISFGAFESKEDYRTFSQDMVVGPIDTTTIPTQGKISLSQNYVNDLCDQRQLGICTDCGVRMGAEWHFIFNHFHDGIRLDEYWGYLMGKVFIDKNLIEGSSAFTMLHTAYKWGIPTQAIRLSKYPLKVDGTYQQFIADFNATYGGKIPQEILNDAANHKIAGYYQIPVNPVSIAKEIQLNHLVICRFAVGENTYTDIHGHYTRDPKKLFPLRAPKNLEGGHIWDINEYNGLDENQNLKGPNSWSEDWGWNGYFEFIFNTQQPYFTEAWAIADRLPEELIEFVKDLPEAINFKYNFQRPIKKEDEGEEVKKLQLALVILGYLNIRVDEWGIYGPKTATAVDKLQRDNTLAPLIELEALKGKSVGPKTRAFLNKKFNK